MIEIDLFVVGVVISAASVLVVAVGAFSWSLLRRWSALAAGAIAEPVVAGDR